MEADQVNTQPVAVMVEGAGTAEGVEMAKGWAERPEEGKARVSFCHVLLFQTVNTPCTHTLSYLQFVV